MILSPFYDKAFTSLLYRYKNNLGLARNYTIRRSFLNGIGFGLLWFFIYGSYALAFWYGVGLIIRDKPLKDPLYTPSVMVTVSNC